MAGDLTSKYAKQVFLDSLITGLPQVVGTRNVGRKIIKCTIMCLCLVSFVYQTTEFMSLFWSYPTVLDIDVEYPEIIESPAITYCNLNGVKRSLYCEKYTNTCTTIKHTHQLCTRFPHFCRINNSEEHQRFPTGDGLQFEGNISSKELKVMGHTSDNLKHCTRISMDGDGNCSLNLSIRIPMDDGDKGLHNCYTLFSSAKSKKLKEHTLPVPKQKNPLFHMVFEMEPHEYFRPDREVGVIVAIHSPNQIVNPFFDGFVVKPGNLYSVHLKVVEEKLLPFPYETKCKDYNTMWVQRNGSGPLSQELCVGECLYNASMKMCECVLKNIMYYHHDPICEEKENFTDECFNFDITQCYNYCQQPCDFVNFEYEIQERKLEDKKAGNVEDILNGASSSETNEMGVVMMFLKRPEIIIYNHRPQYEDIEVFSFVGGYIGIWLGVSFIAVFDFFESVVLIMHFWLQRRLRRRQLANSL